MENNEVENLQNNELKDTFFSEKYFNDIVDTLKIKKNINIDKDNSIIKLSVVTIL